MATLPERGTGPFSDSCLPVTGGRWTRLREQELVEVKLGLPKEEGRWLPLGMATLGATECLILPLPPPPHPPALFYHQSGCRHPYFSRET